MTVPALPESREGVRGNRSALFVLLFASTLTVMAGGLLTPVVELLRADLRLTSTAAGLVVTAHGLSLALSGPAVGQMIDRWGIRGPLGAGLVLYGIAGGIGLLTTSYPVLIASRLVFGVGAAVVFTGTTLALLDLYRGPAQHQLMGWRTTAISLGGVLWPLAGGALGAISWHAPFAVYLLGVPLGLATLRVLSASSAPAAEARQGGQDHGSLFSLFKGRPELVAVYGLQVVAAVLLYAILVFLPLRLAEVGITDPLIVAVFTATQSLVMSLVGLLYARARIRLGQPRLLGLALATWIIAFAVLAVTGAPALMLFASAAFGIGMGLAVPALTVLVAEHAPTGLRGRATALLATATFSGQFATPLLFGPVQAAASLRGVFLAAAGLAGASLVLLFARASRTTGTQPRRWPAGRGCR